VREPKNASFCGILIRHNTPGVGVVRRRGGAGRRLQIANSGGVGYLGSLYCLRIEMGGNSAVKITYDRG